MKKNPYISELKTPTDPAEKKKYQEIARNIYELLKSFGCADEDFVYICAELSKVSSVVENNLTAKSFDSIDVKKYKEEVWRPYTSIYIVSSWGRIKNINTGKITPGHGHGRGNHYLYFEIDGSDKPVHNIVAQLFPDDIEYAKGLSKKDLDRINLPLGNPAKLEIDHIVPDPRNNCARNLRLCTHTQNMNNIETKMAMSNPENLRPVVSKDKKGNIVKKYSSIIEAAEDISESGHYGKYNAEYCIRKAATETTPKGKRISVAGRYWEYIED